MKKYIASAALLALTIIACNPVSNTDTEVSEHPGDNPINNSFCTDTTHRNQFCSDLPYDVTTSFGFGYTAHLDPNIQPAFDVFSWQTFVALNWPADAKGNPIGNDPGAYPDTPRVWEHYKDIEEIFNTDSTLHLQLQDAANQHKKFFYLTSKIKRSSLHLSGFLQADGYPLIDRNLNFAVFEVRSNPIEANFIDSNKLNTVSGIVSFYHNNGNKFQLPASDASTKTGGSIEVKSSWRILDTSKGDDPSRYYTRDAVIHIGAANSVSGQPFDIRAKVGLTGMHIIRKTTIFSKWIWSTFEHIDNTPDNIQDAQAQQPPKTPWSFYYNNTLGLPPNDSAAFQPGDNGQYKFDSKPPYAGRYAVGVPGEQGGSAVFGSQAQRVYPIYYRTQQVNKLWRDKLKGTVWANYKLIGSQWTVGDPGIVNTPNVPAMLGNSTMETFMLSSSSCISCHGFASVISGNDTIATDLSFMIALHAHNNAIKK